MALLAFLLPAPASALSYVMMRDEPLVDAATVIVLADVLYEVRGQVDGRGYVVDSRHVIDVSRALKGRGKFHRLTLRLPGASSSASQGVSVSGISPLAPGDSLLLFLRPRPDGTYAPADLALGVFHEVELAGERYFVRDLDDARNVAKHINAAHHKPRHADRFVAWIADRARGWHRAPDYLEPGKSAALAKFTQVRGGDNNPIRWFKFDSNQAEAWFAIAGGQAGMVRDEFALFQNALAAWTNDASSRILYTYAGTTASDLGNNGTDNKSAIIWNDPGGDIGGSYNCATGGTLAFGGSFFSGGTTSFAGVPYHTIVEGFVIVQDGVACLFDAHNGEDGEETMAHELGHTLGLGHSCGDAQSGSCATNPVGDAALMRASIHSDGRGAALGVDDIAAITLIYPVTGGPGGGKPDPIFANGFE